MRGHERGAGRTGHWGRMGDTGNWLLLLGLGLGLVVGLRTSMGALDQFSTAQVAVYFSSTGGLTDAIVRELTAAQHQVLVHTAALTSPPISQALIAAHLRGVTLQVVLDPARQSTRLSVATALTTVGIPTRLDAQHPLVQSTMLVIDATTVLTGTVPLTPGAETQPGGTLLLLKNAPGLAQQYAAQIHLHAAHAQPYTPHLNPFDALDTPAGGPE